MALKIISIFQNVSIKYRLKRLSLYIGIFFVIVVGWWFQNKQLSLSFYTVETTQIPEAFDGFRIIQLSDLHGQSFGLKQQRLIASILTLKPDLIVMTGDMVDAKNGSLDALESLLIGLGDIPVFFVSGNHEVGIGFHEDKGQGLALRTLLSKYQVHILENEGVELMREDTIINLLGINDAATLESVSFLEEGATAEMKMYYKIDQAKESVSSTDRFTILLSHRAEFIDTYSWQNIDLTFTGHAHGGQWYLPIVGALYAPGQGFLPDYTSGIYQKRACFMIVSRGLGNSSFPFRLFNPPELSLTILKHQPQSFEEY